MGPIVCSNGMCNNSSERTRRRAAPRGFTCNGGGTEGKRGNLELVRVTWHLLANRRQRKRSIDISRCTREASGIDFIDCATIVVTSVEGCENISPCSDPTQSSFPAESFPTVSQSRLTCARYIPTSARFRGLRKGYAVN